MLLCVVLQQRHILTRLPYRLLVSWVFRQTVPKPSYTIFKRVISRRKVEQISKQRLVKLSVLKSSLRSECKSSHSQETKTPRRQVIASGIVGLEFAFSLHMSRMRGINCAHQLSRSSLGECTDMCASASMVCSTSRCTQPIPKSSKKEEGERLLPQPPTTPQGIKAGNIDRAKIYNLCKECISSLVRTCVGGRRRFTDVRKSTFR